MRWRCTRPRRALPHRLMPHVKLSHVLWWIIAAVVGVPLILFAILLFNLRRRTAELDRVATLTMEQTKQATDDVAASAQRLRPSLLEVRQRALRAGEAARRRSSGS